MIQLPEISGGITADNVVTVRKCHESYRFVIVEALTKAEKHVGELRGLLRILDARVSTLTSMEQYLFRSEEVPEIPF